jgi:hypothetical protein
MAKCDNDWIEHDGKGMPVDGDVHVKVKFRDGDEYKSITNASYWDDNDPMASNWVWIYDLAPSTDITHYRIVKENDNG